MYISITAYKMVVTFVGQLLLLELLIKMFVQAKKWSLKRSLIVSQLCCATDFWCATVSEKGWDTVKLWIFVLYFVFQNKQRVRLMTFHVPVAIVCLALGYVMEIMTVETTQMKIPSSAVRNSLFCSQEDVVCGSYYILV